MATASSASSIARKSLPVVISNQDKSVAKTRGTEVSLAAWAFLFSEVVAYTQQRVDSISDFEKRSVCSLDVSARALTE